MKDMILDILLWILKPIIGSAQELVQEIRAIRKNLHYYARQISNPGIMKKEEIDDAAHALRKNATNLTEAEHSVKCFSFLAFMHIAPSKSNVIEASKLLAGLSNSLEYISYNNYNLNDGMRNFENVKKIKNLLLIKPDLCERFSNWLVFFLVALGSYRLFEIIINLTKNYLEIK